MNRLQTNDYCAALDELRAAEAIARDPNCSPRLAAKHVLGAWCLAAGLSTDAAEDDIEGGLIAWLNSIQSPHLADGVRAGLVGGLPGVARGTASGHRTAARDVTRGELFSQIRQLTRLVRILSARPDELERRAVRLRWMRRLLGMASILGVVVLVALRPWSIDRTAPWRGAYYPSEEFDGVPTMRRDRDVNFDWGPNAPMDDIPADKFGARWDTCLLLKEEREVVFQLISDDGSRLYVNGERVIDNWRRGARKSKGERVRLEPGSHHLKVEYFEWKEDAMVQLLMSLDSVEAPAPIPRELLSYPSGDLDDAAPCARG